MTKDELIDELERRLATTTKEWRESRDPSRTPLLRGIALGYNRALELVRKLSQ